MAERIIKERYPGTLPFSVNDQAVFFGRDEDIERFSELMLLEQQIVLYGKSGLGKSSLLNAGILPKMMEKENFLPFQIRFTAYTPDKEDTPSDILRRKISENVDYNNFLWNKIIRFNPDKIDAGTTIPSIEILSNLWYYFKSLQIQDPTKSMFVLVLDQFEELFTYPEEQVSAFAKELADLINVHVPQFIRDRLRYHSDKAELLTKDETRVLFHTLNIKIIISIRSDKMALLNKLKDHIPEILRKTYELMPLNLSQARDAILKPARMAATEEYDFAVPPFEYEEPALAAILNFLSKNEQEKQMIESFQLQIICKHAENVLLARNGNPPVISLKDMGKVEDIFENYYDDRISLVPKDKQLKARLFIEEGLIFEEDQRRLSVYEGQAEKQFGMSPELLSQLMETRLIRTEPHPSGGFSYELSHDTLVAPILKAKARRIEEERHLEELRQKKEEQERRIRLEKEKQRRTIRMLKSAGIVTILIIIALLLVMRSINKQRKVAKAEWQRAEALVMELTTEKIKTTVSNLDKYYSEGLRLQDDRKFSESIQSFNKALEELNNLPDTVKVKYSGMSEQITNGKVESERLMTVSSTFDSLILMGDSLVQTGADYYIQAKRTYETARDLKYDVALARQRIEVLNVKIDQKVAEYKKSARALLNGKKPAFARIWIEKALRMKPQDAELQSMLEMCQ